MSFFDFLAQIYTSSPDWIKALLIVSTGVFSMGVIITAVRFILSWRALSLARDEVRRLNALPPDETNQPDEPDEPNEPHKSHNPFLAPDDDPHFPLAKPEDYAPFNEPYPEEEPEAETSEEESEKSEPKLKEGESQHKEL